MKKFSVILLLASLFLLPANAEFKIGITGGLNLSDLKGDTPYAEQMALSTHYHVGVAAQFGLGKFFAIQPEVLFSTMGASVDTKGLKTLVGGTIDVPEKIHLNSAYVQVPVNLQAGIHLGRLARLYAQAGPYVSFLVSDDCDLSGREFYDAYKQTVANLSESGKEDIYNKVDFGVGVGAGVEISCFQLAAKYDFGLTEFKEVPTKLGGDLNFLSGLKHRNITISLSLLF